jgi:hypothetical protein
MATRIATASLLLLLSATLAAPAGAEGAAEEATLDVLVGTIRANRKALVAVNLQLEDAQAVDFWPVYERYQQELADLSERLVDIIGEYAAGYDSMSDEQAKQLMTRYLAVEQERVALRQRFLPVFSEVLPGRALARLYQIENKMDAVLRFELAAEIPVLEQ